MAEVTIRRCDRCGRYENAHFVVTVEAAPVASTPRSTTRKDDLCDECVELLLRLLDGAKLARPRKTPT